MMAVTTFHASSTRSFKQREIVVDPATMRSQTSRWRSGRIRTYEEKYRAARTTTTVTRRIEAL